MNFRPTRFQRATEDSSVALAGVRQIVGHCIVTFAACAAIALSALPAQAGRCDDESKKDVTTCMAKPSTSLGCKASVSSSGESVESCVKRTCNEKAASAKSTCDKCETAAENERDYCLKTTGIGFSSVTEKISGPALCDRRADTARQICRNKEAAEKATKKKPVETKKEPPIRVISRRCDDPKIGSEAKCYWQIVDHDNLRCAWAPRSDAIVRVSREPWGFVSSMDKGTIDNCPRMARDGEGAGPDFERMISCDEDHKGSCYMIEVTRVTGRVMCDAMPWSDAIRTATGYFYPSAKFVPSDVKCPEPVIERFFNPARLPALIAPTFKSGAVRDIYHTPLDPKRPFPTIPKGVSVTPKSDLTGLKKEGDLGPVREKTSKEKLDKPDLFKKGGGKPDTAAGKPAPVVADKPAAAPAPAPARAVARGPGGISVDVRSKGTTEDLDRDDVLKLLPRRNP